MTSALVTKYMKNLNLETLPQDQINEIALSLEEIRDNQLQSLPMNCEGAKCPFAKTCPLQKKNIAPVGKGCPVEQMLIEEWSLMYARSLGVDPQDYVELSMLADIVEAEIYDRRTTGDISLNKLFDMQAIGVDRDGDPILRKEPAVALEVKKMMKQRKDDIRKGFIATREQRAKYKIGDVEDVTTQLSNIRDEMERITSEGQKMNQLPEPEGILDVQVSTPTTRETEHVPQGKDEGDTWPSEGEMENRVLPTPRRSEKS